MTSDQLDYLQAMGVDVYVRRRSDGVPVAEPAAPQPDEVSAEPITPPVTESREPVSVPVVEPVAKAAQPTPVPAVEAPTETQAKPSAASAQSRQTAPSEQPPPAPQPVAESAPGNDMPPFDDEPPPLDSPYAPSAEPDFSEADPETEAPPANPVAAMNWETLRETVAVCEACELHKTRTQSVFGVGHPNARVMVIGEAPGQDEDRQGEPFVGRAGKLLDQMLKAAGFERQDVFIANILKCRPPNNRDPKPDEAAACRAYLERQIDLVKPEVILSVGRISAQNLLDSDAPVGRLRGGQRQMPERDTPVHVTYHPAYLLRQPSEKRKVWADLQQLLDSLDASGDS